MEQAIVNQGAFTSVIEIKKDKVDALRRELKTIEDTVDSGACPIDFRKLKTVHFMRWVILDEPQGGVSPYVSPPYLVLSTNYDLPLKSHLQDVIEVGGQNLRNIYSHCKGFTEAKTDLSSYLIAGQVDYAAFYVGTRGRTVEEITEENKLRVAIQEFLDEPGYDRTKHAMAIRKDIQEFVSGETHLAWAKEHQRSVTQWKWFFWGKLYIALLLIGLLFASFAGTLACLLLIWFCVVIRKEKREAIRGLPKVPTMGAPLLEQKNREDRIVQNQLSNIVWIKPGWVRMATLRLVLTLITLLGRYLFVRGALGGIPTIHFARWVILKDSRRVIFFSNFDGSWENYLGDFIDKAAVGLTAIWSNCIGCPEAHRLIYGGAENEPHFKAWVRFNQLVTQVWYSKYDELTVLNINNNSLIRLGLFGDKNLIETEQWLARI